MAPDPVRRAARHGLTSRTTVAGVCAVLVATLAACAESAGPQVARERTRQAAPATSATTPAGEPDAGVVTVPVGRGPGRPVLGFGRLWVPSVGNGTLTVVDPEDGSVVGSVDLDDLPDEARFRSLPWRAVVADDAVWVSDRRAGTVLRVDPDTLAVTDRLAVEDVSDIAYDGNGGLWAIRQFPATVTRIDVGSASVTDVVELAGPTPRSAAGLAVGPGVVWVATTSRSQAALVRIDPAEASVVADVALPSETPEWAVEDLAATADGVWAAMPVEPQLAFLATVDATDGADASAVRVVPVPSGVGIVELETDGATVWGTTVGALVELDAVSGAATRVFVPASARELVHLVRGDGGTWVTDGSNHALHFVPDELLTTAAQT